MNKAILVGNIGNAPEITNLENGNKIAKFSIATSETYKNKQGEKVTDTEWHNITAFGKVAEIIEKYFEKGSKILVEGKIKTDRWEKDGVKKYSTGIIMQNFEFVGSAKKEENTF